MDEMNINTNNSGAKKKGSVVTSAAVTLIIIGLVLMLAGFVLAKVFGFGGYGRLTDYEKSFTASEVKSINAEIDLGTFKVVQSEDNEIHVIGTDVPEGFFSSVGNSGVLEIKFNMKKHSIGLFGDSFTKFNHTLVELQIPEKDLNRFEAELGAVEADITGITSGSFSVECGAGSVSLNDISCDDAVINCGTGEFTSDKFVSSETLTVEGGVGEMTFRNSNVGGLDVDQGVGEFSFSGTVNGDIDIDGGVGSFSVDLTNPETDFSINGGKYKLDIDKGIGEASVTYNN